MNLFGVMQDGDEIWEHAGMLYGRRKTISAFEEGFIWKVARFMKLSPNSKIITQEHLEEERRKAL